MGLRSYEHRQRLRDFAITPAELTEIRYNCLHLRPTKTTSDNHNKRQRSPLYRTHESILLVPHHAGSKHAACSRVLTYQKTFSQSSSCIFTYNREVSEPLKHLELIWIDMWVYILMIQFWSLPKNFAVSSSVWFSKLFYLSIWLTIILNWAALISHQAKIASTQDPKQMHLNHWLVTSRWPFNHYTTFL